MLVHERVMVVNRVVNVVADGEARMILRRIREVSLVLREKGVRVMKLKCSEYCK